MEVERSRRPRIDREIWTRRMNFSHDLAGKQKKPTKQKQTFEVLMMSHAETQKLRQIMRKKNVCDDDNYEKNNKFLDVLLCVCGQYCVSRWVSFNVELTRKQYWCVFSLYSWCRHRFCLCFHNTSPSAFAMSCCFFSIVFSTIFLFHFLLLLLIISHENW